MQHSQSQHSSKEAGQMTHFGLEKAAAPLRSAIEQSTRRSLQQPLCHSLDGFVVHPTQRLRMMRMTRSHFVLLPRLNPHLEQIFVVTIRHGSHADVARCSFARCRIQEGWQKTVLRGDALESLVDCIDDILVLGILCVVAEIPRESRARNRRTGIRLTSFPVPPEWRCSVSTTLMTQLPFSDSQTSRESARRIATVG